MKIKELKKITIIGIGLLGGSLGLALRAGGFSGTRVGVGRRQSSLDKALACDAVDEVTQDLAAGVRDTDLVVLCTPISTFEVFFRQLAEILPKNCYVTDVGSTKEGVVRLAERLLPERVRFVGSHPMAGSEKTGVEFARADLFEHSLCLLTPTERNRPADVRWMRSFWEQVGALTAVVDPARHDVLLARVSHLPHAVATALVHLSRKDDAIDVAGPGFADVTRVASGDPGMWRDILQTNEKAMVRSLDQLIKELQRLRQRLEDGESRAIEKWLDTGKQTRDEWIASRYRKKVLPP